MHISWIVPLWLCDSPLIKLGWRAIAGAFYQEKMTLKTSRDNQDRHVYHFKCLNTGADKSDNKKKCTSWSCVGIGNRLTYQVSVDDTYRKPILWQAERWPLASDGFWKKTRRKRNREMSRNGPRGPLQAFVMDFNQVEKPTRRVLRVTASQLLMYKECWLIRPQSSWQSPAYLKKYTTGT